MTKNQPLVQCVSPVLTAAWQGEDGPGCSTTHPRSPAAQCSTQAVDKSCSTTAAPLSSAAAAGPYLVLLAAACLLLLGPAA